MQSAIVILGRELAFTRNNCYSPLGVVSGQGFSTNLKIFSPASKHHKGACHHAKMLLYGTDLLKTTSLVGNKRVNQVEQRDVV